MYKLILLLGLASFLLSASGKHAYYFGFAEMEYKPENNRMELSLSLSLHDLEDCWKAKKIINESIDKELEKPELHERIVSEINQGFQFKADKKSIFWLLDGYEKHRNGLIYFYLHAENVPELKEAEIRFDLLMDIYSEQQNKITFIYAGKKQTAVFFKDNKVQKLRI